MGASDSTASRRALNFRPAPPPALPPPRTLVDPAAAEIAGRWSVLVWTFLPSIVVLAIAVFALVQALRGFHK